MPQPSSADGNGNNKVEAADYYVWRAHYGRMAKLLPAVVPEPAAWFLMMGGVAGLAMLRRRI